LRRSKHNQPRKARRREDAEPGGPQQISNAAAVILLPPDSRDTIRYTIVADGREQHRIGLPHGYGSYGDKVETSLILKARGLARGPLAS